MAAVSASPERIDVSGPMMTDPSPSDVASSDVASESSANVSCSADTPGRDDLSNSSPSPSRDVESLTSLRSEEYRQLFRLPPEEVLVQDFNCAFQESILLQGHMYLFVHHVCFYSNIFGFETKKIISFHEVTSVKRAKTAGIFPNAIEIFAGGKKYFFASFLSRDEAFKLINDGWLQHGDGAKAITEQQESLSEPGNPGTGHVVIEKINSSKHPINELDSINRDMNASASSDSKLLDRFENDESTSCVNPQDNAKQHTEPVMNTESSSVAKTWTWNLENSDAPQIPEYYAKVTETKFPIKVEEFFNLFFSNDAVSFIESFHTRCGDKEFRCSSLYPHEKFGHARDVSFQHPIKIYFGAKFGSCQEVQKFRVYRNSHLVIETSQEINDVPYGDYFRVEGIWDVQRDRDESKDCCILRVYSNVAFTKRTVWKGKIVQSSLEECREVYAAWIDMAHDLLKQKNLEKKEDINPVNLIQGTEVQLERRAQTEELSQRSHDSSDHTRASQMSDAMDFNQRVGNLLQGSYINSGSIASFIRESSMKFCSLLKSHGRISLVLAVAFAVILLMQVSILVLLNRPQYIHVASPVEYMGGRGGGVGGGAAEAISWTEKRIHYLKDEMLMVEARLERMWHEHAVLKAQLKDLEELSKHR